MKDDFDRLFHPRAFSTKWAELSINQNAFKHVGHKEIELEEIDKAGNTAFHVAAAKDFLPIFDIRPFIRGSGSSLKNKEGRTPLHIAAEKGNLMFCQRILTDSRDEVISADNDGMLPIHLAAKAGHLSICKDLLDVLICNNPENKEGVTPLHLAAAEGHLEICQQMLKVIKDKHPNGRYEGDVNPKDNVGSTPLHYAASKGQLHICKLFMQIVADKNPKNNIRFTPLHFAEQKGHISIIELFANNLEDLNKTNKNKFTPLHYAAFNGYLEVAKMLLKKMKSKNMNPNPKDVQGVTPLHVAAQKGHLAIFKLIFDQILIPASRPEDPLTHQEMFKNPPETYAGNTPLHFAVRSGRSSICSMILKNLDCVHPENKSGQTPLDLADGHKPILDLFKRKNFNISLKELVILRIVTDPKKAVSVHGHEYPKGTTIVIKNVGNFELGDEFCDEIVKSMKKGDIFESDMIIGGTICLTIVSNENKLLKTYILEAA